MKICFLYQHVKCNNFFVIYFNIYPYNLKILECLQYLTANKRINTIFNLKVKMEKSALILFKLFAFFIFVYQMKNSITKYVEKPVAQLVSTVNFEQISEPLIYVCQKGQFNYTISKQYGYNSYFSHRINGFPRI